MRWLVIETVKYGNLKFEAALDNVVVFTFQQFMGEDVVTCQGIAHSSETTEVDSTSKNLCAEDNTCI